MKILLATVDFNNKLAVARVFIGEVSVWLATLIHLHNKKRIPVWYLLETSIMVSIVFVFLFVFANNIII